METSLSGKSTGLLSRRGSTHAHNDRGKRPDSSPVACAWDDQRQSPAPYPNSCSRLGAQLGQPKRWSCAFHAMGARQNRVAECDADLHAAGGGLGDREPPFPLEVAQRADRLKRLPQRSRPRTPPGDGGYDEGLGERGRRDPVRARVAARVALRPGVTRAHPGTNGSSAGIRTHPTAPAVAARAPKMAARRGFMFRQRPTTAWKPTRRSPRAQNPCKSGTLGSARPMHRTAGRSHQSTTNALQIVGIMELGGLEPPTSWVRSRRSPN
jgi:hypothetical protein